MLCLASQSESRMAILRAAGVPFDAMAARVDEDSLKASLLADGASPRDVVDALAEYKARKVSSKQGGLVLGCDQVLVFEGTIFGKPTSPGDLRDLMRHMNGRPHKLLTAQVLYKDGEPIWRHIGRVDLTMRVLSAAEIDDHIETHWDDIQHSAGGYHAETTPHLFDDIKGDWFDVLGLSITPLINILRAHGAAGTAKRPVLAGVLGCPIKQSKSPILHGTWLWQHGLQGMYVPVHVPKDQFERTIRILRAAGFAGCNVTIPHKEAALACSKEQSAAARAIGASNTLFFRPDGIVADNTDAFGFMENIRAHRADWSADGQTCLVLGAGGAARAIIFALLEDGAARVFLSNRTSAKAETLAQEFGERVHVLPWDARSSRNTQIDFLVNTTSLGMDGQPSLEFDLSGLRDTTIVTDIVYKPLETNLLLGARHMGCATIDGLGMLLHQAVPGFEGWFGTRPTVDHALRDAVLA